MLQQGAPEHQQGDDGARLRLLIHSGVEMRSRTMVRQIEAAFSIRDDPGGRDAARPGSSEPSRPAALPVEFNRYVAVPGERTTGAAFAVGDAPDRRAAGPRSAHRPAGAGP